MRLSSSSVRLNERTVWFKGWGAWFESSGKAFLHRLAGRKCLLASDLRDMLAESRGVGVQPKVGHLHAAVACITRNTSDRA